MQSVLVSVVLGFAVLPAAPVSIAYSGITSGRAQALVALVVGLISVVLGGRALARSGGDAGTATRRGRVIVPVAAGLIGLTLGGVRLASSTAIGTGSGRLGAIIAVVVALIGTVLGGLALARSRRAA
jgi:hypothetical protein